MTKVARVRSSASFALAFVSVFVGLISVGRALGQDADPDRYVVRTPPPAGEDFETDENKDGVPDGWYNARDVKLVTEGGAVQPHFIRFECSKPGRPARLSRAFGIDGKKFEAIVIGLWVRLDQIQTGERLGEEPGLMIDFLGDQLRQQTRGSMGPWTARNMGSANSWTRVSKRIPVPPGTKDAIMSIGLLGATGVLDIDGFTFDLIPLGGSPTTNLIRNPGFELGDPEPNGWIVDNGARRSSNGYRSHSSLELAKSGARAMSGLALPVDRFSSIEVSAVAKAANLRGSGGAVGRIFFLDAMGGILEESRNGIRVFLWSGVVGLASRSLGDPRSPRCGARRSSVRKT